MDSMDTTTQVHLVPCSISVPDGVTSAKVSKYFEPTIKTIPVHSTQGKDVLCASLRGRPLKGIPIQLPTGYHGFALKEDKSSVSPDVLIEDLDGTRKLSVEKTFSSFKYWTLDAVPSQDDKYLSTIKWIDISQTLHHPVDNTTSSDDYPSQ